MEQWQIKYDQNKLLPQLVITSEFHELVIALAEGKQTVSLLFVMTNTYLA